MKRINTLSMLSLLVCLLIGGMSVYFEDYYRGASYSSHMERKYAPRSVVDTYKNLFSHRTRSGAGRAFAVTMIPLLFFSALIYVASIFRRHIGKSSGIFMIVSAVGLIAWSLLVYVSPGAIGVDEVYLAWLAYAVVGILVSVWPLLIKA